MTRIAFTWPVSSCSCRKSNCEAEWCASAGARPAASKHAASATLNAFMSAPFVACLRIAVASQSAASVRRRSPRGLLLTQLIEPVEPGLFVALVGQQDPLRIEAPLLLYDHRPGVEERIGQGHLCDQHAVSPGVRSLGVPLGDVSLVTVRIALILLFLQGPRLEHQDVTLPVSRRIPVTIGYAVGLRNDLRCEVQA